MTDGGAVRRIRSTGAGVGQPRIGPTGAVRRGSIATVAVLAGAGLVSACGSSSSSSPSPSTPGAVTATCNQVSAVLSDGPDPGADPVGYAEAQVLPLHQIHTSDHRLQSAIDRLASAYQQVSTSDGAAQATNAASRALASVSAICPGAGS
jgi:hypothetical protein